MARSDLAGRVWPHLQADRAAPREQRREPSELAKLMYPAHVPKPPSNPMREALLRNLREINARDKGRR
jgi:hypothetical protein